jgi:hypothetical protein
MTVSLAPKESNTKVSVEYIVTCVLASWASSVQNGMLSCQIGSDSSMDNQSHSTCPSLRHFLFGNPKEATPTGVLSFPPRCLVPTACPAGQIFGLRLCWYGVVCFIQLRRREVWPYIPKFSRQTQTWRFLSCPRRNERP